MATSMNTSLAKKNDENIMAYILSDQNEIPLRVSVFTGTDKASPLFSVKEFGNTCIFYSMEKILKYGAIQEAKYMRFFLTPEERKALVEQIL